MQLTTEMVLVEDELYKVIRKIREDHKPIVDVWKEHLNADKVFRKDGVLIFCQLIPQAEIVNE